ncbi:phospholipid phosphatase 5-like [Apostichopus japonicus]|uniref:phospholipid phosphatase 5-like n=1 Tax=Stichopus japonicus TaxID=307972 RepID=UPI003AB555DE
MAFGKSSFLDSMAVEILLRILLFVAFVFTDKMKPFQRIIQPEEWWLYNNPRTDSYVSTNSLYVLVSVVPMAVIIITSGLKRHLVDAKQATLALSLGFGINCALTNAMKLLVGRPRPDFLERCFPNGVPKVPTIITAATSCNGIEEVIYEGQKSFPSGHSSFIFASYTFLSLYLAGKLHIFESRHRGHSLRLLLAGFPLFFALLCAISRTMDYHHHWQDVSVGSILGIFCATISYYQYYPELTHPECHLPLRHKSSPKFHRTMSDSRLSKGTRTWALEDSAEKSVPLLEVKEM